MTAPSGFTDSENAFVIVRSLPGNRLKIVNIFPSGQLAIEDAGERFVDTGGEYTILRSVGVDFVKAASGVLQNQIDSVESVSGITTIINQPGVISVISSGVLNQIFQNLPLIGDTNDYTVVDINNIPVAELDSGKSVNFGLSPPNEDFVRLFFKIGFFPEKTETSEVVFRLAVRHLPSGVDTSLVAEETTDLSITRSWVANEFYREEIEFNPATPPLGVVSVKFQRQSDSYTGKIYIANYAVRFEK